MFNFIVDFSSWFVIIIFAGNFLRRLIEGYIKCSNYMSLEADKKLEELKKSHELINSEFNEEQFKKSIDYTKTSVIFNCFSSGIIDTISIVLLILGFNAFILNYLNTFNLYFPIKLFIVFSLFNIVFSLISLPMDFIDDKIEKKFGYSTMTTKLMVVDKIKETIISCIFNFVLLLFFYNFLEYLTKFTSKYLLIEVCLIFFIASIVFWIIEIIYSYFIMPLFNKFLPLEEGELKTKLFALANKCNIKIKDIYVMDASKRSKKGNAFCLDIPFGPTKLVLFDTLFDQVTTNEIVAIMAHEFAHKKHKHALVLYIMIFFFSFLSIFISLYFVFDQNLYKSFGYKYVNAENIKDYTIIGILLMLKVFNSVSWVFNPFTNFISRLCEYNADKNAAKYTESPEDLITGLIKIHAKSGSIGITNDNFEFWFMDHPSLLNRIKELNKLKEK